MRAVGDSRRPTGGGSGVAVGVAGTGTGSVNGQFLPSEVQNRVQLEQLTWLAKLQVREHCRGLSVIGSSWRFLSLPIGCHHRLVGLRSSEQEIIPEQLEVPQFAAWTPPPPRGLVKLQARDYRDSGRPNKIRG